jgi:hypothetical protein
MMIETNGTAMKAATEMLLLRLGSSPAKPRNLTIGNNGVLWSAARNPSAPVDPAALIIGSEFLRRCKQSNNAFVDAGTLTTAIGDWTGCSLFPGYGAPILAALLLDIPVFCVPGYRGAVIAISYGSLQAALKTDPPTSVIRLVRRAERMGLQS